MPLHANATASRHVTHFTFLESQQRKPESLKKSRVHYLETEGKRTQLHNKEHQLGSGVTKQPGQKREKSKNPSATGTQALGTGQSPFKGHWHQSRHRIVCPEKSAQILTRGSILWQLSWPLAAAGRWPLPVGAGRDSPRPYAIQLRSRRSLTSIGIRNHRDALAVYFRWIRQRYYIAQTNTEHELVLPAAESVAATCDVADGHDSHDPAATVGIQFDTERINVELLGISVSPDDDVPYPNELDLLG
ncbi:predicted protein [Pyrenophora tritici-repentis Pt-1C-BFP]|uniref:Uncharacterized protein n=1 Tax=Pyrenophora tritici-repentis (strain Pt-1C-BFP) TaxID=426418 RepID=B2VS71_PYRTR|nr:uncharacterized protein PTRG_01697 [Pyrenophora tritici-repentis Pt-1C-BFP]EDU41135.1 predicted protein [Pyrenophora tritici-repentis Pt-1C-BFP]